MSEEKRKRKKKHEDVLKMGRLLGTLSRQEPELWEELKMEEALTGVPAHKILRDALQKRKILLDVEASGLTMSQMLAAWSIYERIQDYVMRWGLTFGVRFMYELLSSVGQLISAIRAEQERSFEERYEQRAREDIRMRYVKTLMPIMETLVNMVTPILMQAMPKTAATPAMKQPQQQEKPKIDLEILEE